MGYHYDPLLAIFDGWILILLITLAVMAGVRLRGRRRLFVAGGFGLWALATALWLPPVLGWLFSRLEPVVGYEAAQQVPLLPWLAGVLLITAGVFLPAPARSPNAAVKPAYPPPQTPRPPAPPGHPDPRCASPSSSPRRWPRHWLEA